MWVVLVVVRVYVCVYVCMYGVDGGGGVDEGRCPGDLEGCVGEEECGVGGVSGCVCVCMCVCRWWLHAWYGSTGLGWCASSYVYLMIKPFKFNNTIHSKYQLKKLIIPICSKLVRSMMHVQRKDSLWSRNSKTTRCDTVRHTWPLQACIQSVCASRFG